MSEVFFNIIEEEVSGAFYCCPIVENQSNCDFA